MDYISSPFLAGLIHPIIVLPKRDLAHMDLIMHHIRASNSPAIGTINNIPSDLKSLEIREGE